ncbi:MAG: nucleoside phosphorylase [Bacteroidales bacterium]|nr:nucleoside phosphorylase [Bacteroidales bacterium]
MNYSESELILNPDGSIYHLHLLPEQIANDIILVGDPNRVYEISKFFDSIEHQISNREFVTHTGYLNHKKLTVIGTGIGTDNIDIVVNELDALVNIDLKTRTNKSNFTSLNLIRLGTSGSLQPDIEVDSFVASEYGLGFDGLLNFYAKSSSVMENLMTEHFIAECHIPSEIARPYIVKCSTDLMNKLAYDYHQGITATASGFYGPQGRTLRLAPQISDLNERLQKFRFEDNRITNFEMETSALYGLGKMLNHNALTICAIIANRPTKTFSKNYHRTIETLIKTTLTRLVK